MTAPIKIKHLWLWIVIAVVVVIGVFAQNIANLLTDYAWFKELRMGHVFITMFSAQVGIAVISGVASFGIILVNLLLAQKLAGPVVGGLRSPLMDYVEAYGIMPFVKYILPLGAMVIAFFFAAFAGQFWDSYLTCRGSVAFGSADPLLGKDISFYVFRLPFYRFVYNGITAILVLSLAGSGIVYFLRQNITFTGRWVKAVQAAKAHILILTGLLVASLYVFFQFRMFDMVNGGGHIINGAGYADIHFYLPFLKAMRFICLAAAGLIWVNIWTKTLKFAIAGILLVILMNIIGKSASGLVQRFVVLPNEVSKETPYINWSIKSTRAAFNLDKIEQKHFLPNEDLTKELVQKNDLTIKNIRLWDAAPLLTTFSQLQEIRTYYKFLDVDNDRYMINGKLRQVMFSPRELVAASLPSRIWINEHLSYTHGYGLCMGPVNNVTAEGLPEFFIKNIPPESNTGIAVTRPEIYYGEADAGYCIVKTRSKEFDYPSGDENVYTTYEGNGGVTMGGLLKKLLFVVRFGELKILLSTDISSQSRILYFRKINERVKKAMPFLAYDADPYMVVANDGRLVWFIDAYTTSTRYPYSAYVQGMGNYIRNSVKVTIDAYNGTVSYYISDPSDPIIRAYATIFPSVFRPLSEMPADLRNHIRYPQSLFAIQAKVYSLYHMTDPQVFYNKEDLWKIPESFSEGQTDQMTPYYTIMKLAEVGRQEEFILMVPFSPAKKENMIAWLAARCDEPNYGKLLVFDFPKQMLVYGPQQIESRINQDPDISKQITLWNQGGSRVIWGSLLVIPVEQSLLYVQPLYIAAENGGVPELKRVIVSYANNIAMEETLQRSLDVIFGVARQNAGAETPAVSPLPGAAPIILDRQGEIKRLISDANRQFEKAQDELAKKNWAGYGAAMNEVQRLLKEMGAGAK
jgi:uncharacterized membrane protein (UPF0182 family)